MENDEIARFSDFVRHRGLYQIHISALILSARIEEYIEKLVNHPNFLHSIMIAFEAIIRCVATISSSFHLICIDFLGLISPPLVHIKIKKHLCG